MAIRIGNRRGRKCRLLGTGVSLCVLAAAACTSGSGQTSPPVGEDRSGGSVTVVTNAQVYTMKQGQPWAEAFAYTTAGVIVAVGTTDEVVAAVGDNITTVDADGNMILPGFQDVHVHVPEAGINQDLCFMNGSDDDDKIANAKVLQTVVAGNPVYDATNDG